MKLSKHGLKRRNKTIDLLLRAKDSLEIERLYLTVDGRNDEQLYKTFDAMENVTIALDKLTEEVETDATDSR